MALNLWKIGGMATSFNPLPLGFVNKVPVLIKPYTLRFKAKSPTSAVLKIVSDATVYQYITLSTDYKDYSFDINSLKQENFFLKDETNAGNIIIDSIELVQKPLPKLTINGIDGFKSGKWTLNSVGSIIDDENINVTSTTGNQGIYLLLTVTPNTNYVFSCVHNGKIGIYNSDASAAIANYTTGNTLSFNSGNNTSIRIYLTVLTIGTFNFSKPMLNLGSIPAPYEKKRGDKMVLPVAKKNYFSSQKLADFTLGQVTVDDTLQQVTINATAHNIAKSFTNLQGKTLTFSWNTKKGTSAQLAYSAYDVTNTRDIVSATQYASKVGSDWTTISFTFTVPSNCNDFKVYPLRDGGTTGTVFLKDFQLEEGTTATAYTPYAVQVNPKPKKWVAKKNMIPPFTSSDWIQDSVATGGTMVVDSNNSSRMTLTTNNTNGQARLISIPVINGKTYTLSFGEITGLYRVYKGKVTTYSGSTLVIQDTLPATFTVDSSYNGFITIRLANTALGSVNFGNGQLEEGSTATTYEPYQLVTPKAKTGLSFNGVTDYLQLPSMTMDSVEIECLIDSVQPQSNPSLVDGRAGLANAFFTKLGNLGSAWNSLIVDGVNKPNKLWSDMPTGQRTKVKVSTNPFTDDVNIFSAYGNGSLLKGIIYKVTCYLNNAIVAQYDFENNRAMAGSSVVPVVTGAPGKNLFDGQWESGLYDSTTGAKSTGSALRSVNFIPVIPNANYTTNLVGGGRVSWWTQGQTFISSSAYTTGVFTSTAPSNAYYAKFYAGTTDSNAVAQTQFELGSTATPYEPFTLLPTTNPLNLIPSFEDARWSIHANAKVLGRDYVQHIASAGLERNNIFIDVLPNTNYLFTVNTIGDIAVYDSTVTTAIIAYGGASRTVSFNSGNNTKVNLNIRSKASGTYEIIRPQLYQLSGKEGTLSGSPTQLNKHAKRRLYAKR